jgi:hypothetical protein
VTMTFHHPVSSSLAPDYSTSVLPDSDIADLPLPLIYRHV